MTSAISNKLLKLILTGLISISLAACGSGGSSDGGGGVAATTVSGKATAPGGAVAMFEEQTLFKLAGNFLMPAATAGISGLEPVTGATVELIRVDNNGIQVGDVLASTQTSITGDYQLSLPAGIDFASNLVLRITAPGGATLDAQAVTQTVNIDPYSTFLLDKLVENGTALDTLATNEVFLLKGRLEDFDLTAGSDMSEMLAALEEATGEFVDTSIETINNGEGLASSVAGSYHLGEFSLSLHDSDNNNSGTFASDISLGSAVFSDGGGSSISGTFELAKLDAYYNLLYSGEGSHYLETINEIEEAETESGEVDGSGSIIIETEFEEELQDCDSPTPQQDCFGWRFPSITVRMEPVADTGIFLSRFSDAGVRYFQTAEGSLDPDAKAGDEIFNNFIILAPQSTEATNASLSGDYGVVGFEAIAFNGSGNTVIEGFYSVEQFDGAGGITETMFNGHALTRTPNNAAVPETDVDLENSTYVVSANGSLEISDIPEQGEAVETDNGFISSDAQLIALFYRETAEDESVPPTIISADQGMMLGLKLPIVMPDMSGKQFKLYNLMFGYGNADNLSATTMSSLTDAVIQFNDGGTNISVTADRSRGIERDTDTGNIGSFSEVIGDLATNTAVIVGDNGMISSTLSLDGGTAELELKGFVSAAGDMLVLRSIYTEGDIREVGIFIGALIGE